MPTQHDERTEDDAVVSQTLTCQTPQLLEEKPISKFQCQKKQKNKKTIQLKKWDEVRWSSVAWTIVCLVF